MAEFFSESMFFGAVISILAYALGVAIQKRWKYAIFNPMLIAIVAIILVLTVMGIDYEMYNKGAEYITYFLTPATVCFAIPLYEQYERLKKNWRALLAGSISGRTVQSCCLFFCCRCSLAWHTNSMFRLLPKSITTAIGIALSGELGGIPTSDGCGDYGDRYFWEYLRPFRFAVFSASKSLRRSDLAIGAAAHAIGTVRAREIGEEEGAISSLSIVVCGLLTVLAASFFAGLY